MYLLPMKKHRACPGAWPKRPMLRFGINALRRLQTIQISPDTLPSLLPHQAVGRELIQPQLLDPVAVAAPEDLDDCLLYTSDAADD